MPSPSGGTSAGQAALQIILSIEVDKAKQELLRFQDDVRNGTANSLKRASQYWHEHYADLIKQGNGAFSRLKMSQEDFNKASERYAKEQIKRQKEVAAQLDSQAKSLHYLTNSLNVFAAASAVGFGLMIKSMMESHQVLVGTQAIFTGLLGSEQAAVSKMAEIRAEAIKANVPILDMYKSARELGPTLKLAGLQMSRLTEAASVSRRLSVLNPEQGTQGAAFAISEFMQGETRSLRTRFRISPEQIEKFMTQANGDRLRALGLLLDDIGITSETAASSMANLQVAFENLGQTFGVFMASGPEPFIKDFLIPMVNNLSQAIVRFQELNPNSARAVSLFIALGLAIPPVIFAILKLTSAYIALAQAQGMTTGGLAKSIGGGALKLGGLAGAVGAGLGGAGIIQNAAASTAGKEKVLGLDVYDKKNESFDEMVGRLQTFFSQVILLAPLAMDSLEKLKETIKVLGAMAVKSWGELLQFVGALLKASVIFGVFGQSLIKTGEFLVAVAKQMGINSQMAIDASNRQTEAMLKANLGIEESASAIDRLEEMRMSRLSEATKTYEASEDAMKSYEQYFLAAQEASKKFMDSLQALTKGLEQDLNDEGINNFKKLMEIDKDWQDKQADLTATYNEKLADIHKQTNEQRISIETSHTEKMNEIRASAQEDEARRLEEFQLRMQRMKEDHEMSLIDAASRLDALAVIKEMQSYEVSRRRAKEDFDLETKQKQQQLTNQLLLEQKNYEKQITQLNESEAKKFADLQAWYAKEREAGYRNYLDRIRVEEERHANEMQDLRDNYAQRRAELTNQYIEETNNMRRKEMDKQLAMLGIQTSYQNAMQNSFAMFWQNLQRIAANGSAIVQNTFGSVNSGGHTGGGGYSGSYAKGTDFVPQAGMYYLHRGEQVIPSGHPDNKYAGEGTGKQINISIGDITGLGSSNEIADTVIGRIVEALQ